MMAAAQKENVWVEGFYCGHAEISLMKTSQYFCVLPDVFVMGYPQTLILLCLNKHIQVVIGLKIEEISSSS